MMSEKKEKALIKLGENVRVYRNKLAISQEELAYQAGIERSYIGKVENGHRNLTILSVLKISGTLGVTLSDLVKGVESA